MNISINGIKTVVTQGAGRSLLLTQKFAPEILTTVGISGVVVAAVMASRATLKLETVADKIELGVDLAKERKVTLHADAYSSTDYKKDIARTYARGAVDLTKIYGPSVSLGLVSIGCILGAHGIMQRRNTALVAGYAVLEKGITEYRKRVAEELGEEKEREIHAGARTEEVSENGKKVTKVVYDPNAISGYARFFDEGNVNWQRVPEYNRLFLQNEQNYANDLLHARGHLFLNEVYDRLGMEHSGAGAVVGWLVSKEGDNYVDFGIFDPTNDQARAFVNGQERSILLDFNVDGTIFDKI